MFCAATLKRLLLAGMLGFILPGCVTTPPLKPGEHEPALSDCPPLPNCASTEAAASSMHVIPAFELDMPIDRAWPIIKETVRDLPGTEILREDATHHYLYAKAYSDVLGFVDYFEVLARPLPRADSGAQRLAVRSAAMLGISDMGVNEARTERFREMLRDRGVIKP